MKKKIAMLACVAAAIALLCACGGGLDGERKEAAEQAVMPALEEMMSARNIKGALYFEYSYSSGGKTTAQKIDVDFEEEGSAADPEKMHMTGEFWQGGSSARMETYTFTNGEGLKTQYICMGDPGKPGDWQEAVPGGEADGSMEMADGMLSGAAYGFTAEKMEKVAGRDAIRLNGYAGMETYSRLLAGAVEGLRAEKLGQTEIPYTVWLDAQSMEVLQYEIDLKDAMGVVMKAALEAEGYDGTEVKVDSMLIRMRIDEANGEGGVTIPQAIERKEDVQKRTDGILEKYAGLVYPGI